MAKKSRRLLPRVTGVVAATSMALSLGSCTFSEKSEEKALESCEEHLKQGANVSASGGGDEPVVSTSDPYASWAACGALAKGGTAADAAVAAQLVLGLTEPQVSGPGGGSVAMTRDGKSDALQSYDSTVYAPASYEPGESAGSRIGVPSTLQLMRTLNEDAGKLDLAELAEPAVRLAHDGFEVSERLVQAVEEAKYPAITQDLYGKDAIAPGDTVHNPRYGDLIGAWAEADGRISDADMDSLRDDLRNAAADEADEKALDALASTWSDGRDEAPKGQDPQCVDYEGANVCGVDSPATGSNIVLPALGILDHEDLGRLAPYDNKGYKVPRSTAAHLMVEAERLAFTEGNTWMGDPGDDGALQDITKRYRDEVVMNQDYYRDAAQQIHQKRSIKSPEPTKLGDTPYRDFNEDGTSQLSITDRDGNVVSMTSTLQSYFGSGVVAGGFPLNNSLDNFTGESPEEPNSPAPLRHPKTTMSPMILTRDAQGEKGGNEVLAIGSPGGTKIPSYVIKNIVATQAWGLSVEDAVRMPNFGSTTRSASYIETDGDYGKLKDVKRAKKRLQEWGHSVDTGTADSGANLVSTSEEKNTAAADPRRDGAAYAAGP